MNQSNVGLFYCKKMTCREKIIFNGQKIVIINEATTYQQS
jgi:hypothetical protein